MRVARAWAILSGYSSDGEQTMNGADELNPQAMALMTEIVSRLAELRNVLILVGLATNQTGAPRSKEAAAAALDKLRELADAFNL